MTYRTRRSPLIWSLFSACFCLSALAQDAEDDALSLEAEPSKPASQSARVNKFYVEGALGAVDNRYQTQRKGNSRVSADWIWSDKISDSVKATVSNRIDRINPNDTAMNDTVNSLREAYLSWQVNDGNVLELGRINLRNGPAYGYNPTDFFRDSSLRTITTANPIALRETRMGSVMLRGQHLWTGGGLSLAYSPKLGNTASTNTYDLNLGATNNRDRWLASISGQLNDRISGQILAYQDDKLPTQWGLNLTALVSDAAVAHAEWASSKELTAYQRALGQSQPRQSVQRYAAGLTYTFPGKLSLTGEMEHSDFAMSREEKRQLQAANSSFLPQYLGLSEQSQELSSRNAFMLYAKKQDALLRNFDLTAMLKQNTDDHSRMTWLEGRYHWPKFDAAAQIQFNSGSNGSDYGVLPERKSFQLIGTYFF